jgi:FG-GAP-like repeat
MNIAFSVLVLSTAQVDPFLESRTLPYPADVIAAGDIDGDTDTDLVIGSQNGVRSLLGNGSLDFTAPFAQVETGVTDLVLIRFDTDNKLDVVTAAGSELLVRFGDGVGGFGVPTTLANSKAYALRAADVDADGFEDVLAYMGSKIRVYRGSSTSISTTPIESSSYFFLHSFDCGDMNLDGFLDATASGFSGYYCWPGTGTGAFGAVITTPGGPSIESVVADFDLDGKPDLLSSADTFSSVELWSGLGDGTFAASATFGLALKKMWTVDLDGDLDHDVAGIEATTGLFRFDRALGPASFAPPERFQGVSNPRSFAAHDLDGDGRKDFIVGGDRVEIYRASSPGGYEWAQWTETAPPSPLVLTTAATTGDFDDDGLSDAVVPRLPVSGSGLASELDFLRGNGAGGLVSTTTSATSVALAGDLTVGDVDGDGDLDIVAAVAAGGFQTFVNTASGSFFDAGSVNFASTLAPTVALGDHDLDGDPDVAISSRVLSAGNYFNSLAVFPGQAGSQFGGPISLLSQPSNTPAIRAIEFTDATGDGRDDVVIANAVTSITLFAALPAGGFAAATIISSSGAFDVHRARVAHLNGDSLPDLVGFSSSVVGGTGAIQVWTGSGSGFVAGPTSQLVLPALDGALDDVNADGKLDVVAQPLSVALATGTGTFQQLGAYATGGELVAEPTDFDRDGRNDYVVLGYDRVGVVSGRLSDLFHHFGSGCAGSGGFTPRLRLSGAPVAGANVSLSIERGLGGSTALFLTGAAEANLPLPGGCSLYASPLLPSIVTIPLSAGGPGDGEFHLTAAFPSVAAGASIVFQALVIDPGVPRGYAATNGATIFTH